MYGKRKSMGDEIFWESGWPSKAVGFEIGDGSEEESLAMQGESGTVNGVRSFFDSVDTQKILTVFSVSELAMARSKADEMVAFWMSGLVVKLSVCQL